MCSVCAIDTARVWAAGHRIIHTTDGSGPIMNIQQIGTEIPIDYQLSQNYPNPFNPSTTIKFGLAKNSLVKISVYDMLGREVAQLVNERLN